jgi:hypothetical protein
MIKKLKKLLGICEHRWIIAASSNTRLCDRGRWDALQFTVKIICENCGTHKRVESEYFDAISISSHANSLSGTKYWINADDCEEALIKTSNANIVWESFNIKCKKKYNIDIKAKYHI